jgi:hypothetical protein
MQMMGRQVMVTQAAKATDAYGAQTQRGSTNANNYFNQQRNALSFMGRT